MINLGVVAGILAMLGWGIGNFVQAKPIKKIGPLKVMFILHIINLIIFSPLVVFLFLNNYISITLDNLILIALFTILQVLGIYYSMKSLEIGEVSLVVPIGSSSTIITIFLSIIFLKETLSTVKGMGIIFAILGIILTSTDFRKLKKIKSAKGVNFAIISLFFFGIYMFGLGLVSKRINDVLTIIAVTRILTSGFSAGYAILQKGIITKNEIKEFKWNFFALFFLFNFAFWSYQYGVTFYDVSLINPISSLQPAVTVALAVIFLKEKLISNQKFGIAMTLLGLFILGFA
ncbi:DMT family transporter [archaeon]|jgi:drug/metabolite transporter (DMT)-like permease|nr:DMT family transporter [archaeon]MBT4022898.1 DMT family transporter [archaeon]MBT4272545.1 DMT family transporter [archaeon]MBT4460387.1 DMT family transporter [archaeon]MBT4859018.1 DMT family transporter [archaeon]